MPSHTFSNPQLICWTADCDESACWHKTHTPSWTRNQTCVFLDIWWTGEATVAGRFALWGIVIIFSFTFSPLWSCATHFHKAIASRIFLSQLVNQTTGGSSAKGKWNSCSNYLHFLYRFSWVTVSIRMLSEIIDIEFRCTGGRHYLLFLSQHSQGYKTGEHFFLVGEMFMIRLT